jgi:HSP20 family protein
MERDMAVNESGKPLTGPLDAFERLRREMDLMFQLPGSNWRPEAGGQWTTFGQGQGMWSPSIELSSRDADIIVRVDLPGIEKNAVRVELTPEGLVIEGERMPAAPSDRVFRSERLYGKFYRRIALPDAIDSDRISATFHNGVLEIVVPTRTTFTRGRQIQVALHPGLPTTDAPPPPPPKKKTHL